jgi:hypothetical protein
MSSYEEKLKEEKIAQILKAYKWTRPLSTELKAEIDEFFSEVGYGCWFVDWLSSRIWCWLMNEWAKTDDEGFKERIHWEDFSDDEEEEEETKPVWYGGCPECGEPQDKPFEDCCAGCVIRRNREFVEMVEEETLTIGKINKLIEDNLMAIFGDNRVFDDIKEDLDEDEERLNWMREILEDNFISYWEKTNYDESQFSASSILEMQKFIKDKQGEYGHEDEEPIGIEKIFNLYAYFIAREHYYRMSRPTCHICDELATIGEVDGKFWCKLCILNINKV